VKARRVLVVSESLYSRPEGPASRSRWRNWPGPPPRGVGVKRARGQGSGQMSMKRDITLEAFTVVTRVGLLYYGWTL